MADNNTNAQTPQQPPKLTLVLGGTGKTGRRVVERLTTRSPPARVGSRSGEPPFDWEVRATWVPVLQNVESVYVTYYPDVVVLDGRNAHLKDGVRRALDREPRDFSDYARDTAFIGVWDDGQ